MASVTDLRAGATYEEDGNIFEVISYEHIKMGRGSANIKLKVRNLRSGATMEKSFINGANVKAISLQKKELQYLYNNGEVVSFMDNESFEQFEIPVTSVAGYEFLKEGGPAIVRFFNDEPLALFLPPKVTLKVADTPPGVKGNSASNVYKDATLENGMKVRVPLFINNNDEVVVDTRDGSYTRRA